MHPALKALFLSQEKTPMLLKKFFEDELIEIYLWQMHSLVYISGAHSGDGEGEQFSCGSKENSRQGPHHAS